MWDLIPLQCDTWFVIKKEKKEKAIKYFSFTITAVYFIFTLYDNVKLENAQLKQPFVLVFWNSTSELEKRPLVMYFLHCPRHLLFFSVYIY